MSTLLSRIRLIVEDAEYAGVRIPMIQLSQEDYIKFHNELYDEGQAISNHIRIYGTTVIPKGESSSELSSTRGGTFWLNH